MIVLDTNVLSEPLRPQPDLGVMRWLADVARVHEVAMSAVTAGELLRGVAGLPNGRRRDAVAAAVEKLLDAHVGRILPYDARAARAYAGLYERRRRLGRPLATEDGMIAATAFVRRASVATRNVADFADLDLEVINPWNA